MSKIKSCPLMICHLILMCLLCIVSIDLSILTPI